MPQLAEMFGVSLRTIQRDILEIEATFYAPLEIKAGRYGGITVLGNHTFERAYMRDEELLLLQKVQSLVKEQISEQENNLFSRIINKYSKSA